MDTLQLTNKQPSQFRETGRHTCTASIVKQSKSEVFDIAAQIYSNWIQIFDFSARVTLKFDRWHRKTIGHLLSTMSSFVCHFKAIGEFKLGIQYRNAQFGSKSMVLCPIARPPHQPPVILSGTPELGLTPLTCVCWQINSILANIGHRNSIRILNQYPFWWNILIWA